MLSQDTHASNKITPHAPQELPIHESPSAEFPAVLSEENIRKACETVWNRLVNEGGQVSFQVSHFFPLGKCYKALSSRNPGIGKFRDWALEIHTMVFDVGMDIQVARQEYLHSYASKSAPVTGRTHSTSTSIPPPTSTSTYVPGPGRLYSDSGLGRDPTTPSSTSPYAPGPGPDPTNPSSTSTYVPGLVSDTSSDSAPIAPSKPAQFPKPVGKASDGKEDRKDMWKSRGVFAPQHALFENLYAVNNDGNGNQSSSPSHAPQSPENGGPKNGWDTSSSQSPRDLTVALMSITNSTGIRRMRRIPGSKQLRKVLNRSISCISSTPFRHQLCLSIKS